MSRFPDRVLSATEGAYPRRLRGLARPPGALYIRGTLADRPVVVAIVGARTATCAGQKRAFELGRGLGRHGALVISGGAVGIDAAAHRGALAAGAPTMAVLAAGLDRLYPERNKPLFAEICASGGGLMSPFCPGLPPRRGHFVRRNQVMAGLADAVLAVEAGGRSGALHTAGAARDLGRVVAAMPGSAGCDGLLARGAALVTCPEDLLAALGGRPRRPAAALPPPGSGEAAVLEALDPVMARGEDEVAEATGQHIRAVLRALTALELEGLALVLPGNRYVRSELAEESLRARAGRVVWGRWRASEASPLLKEVR